MTLSRWTYRYFDLCYRALPFLHRVSDDVAQFVVCALIPCLFILAAELGVYTLVWWWLL